jgi:hypothetical protein
MTDLNTIAQNRIKYWQSFQAKVLLERIQKNIFLVNTPPNAITINVVGGTLFHLAAQYYGDAAQWALIASANNMTDPMIIGNKTLLIPPLNGIDTGGIIQ